MEVLGAVSGIAGLLSLTISVYQISAKYVSSVRNSSNSIRSLLRELRALKKVLIQIDTATSSLDHNEIFQNIPSSLLSLEGSAECREALEELSRSLNARISGSSPMKKLRNLAWPFAEDKTRQSIEVLHRYRCILETALTHDTFIGVSESFKAVKILERGWRSERFGKILEWLSVSSMGHKQDEFLSIRHEDTGQWLLETDEFLEWMDEDSQSYTLWCPGSPGAGKSVMASIIVDHLATEFEDENIGLAYVYCNYNDQSTQTAVAFMASLAKQLSSEKASLPRPLELLYETLEMGERRPDLKHLRSLLISLADSFDRTFVVVDGLDECCLIHERALFMESLRVLAKKSVRVLITSRPNLEDINLQYESVLQVAITAIDSDIEKYVRDRTNEDGPFKKRINGELGQKIVKTIVHKSHGMFLMAVLQLERISAERTVTRILGALETLPTRVADVYIESLARIRAQPDPDQSLGLKVLLWVTHCKRPLLVDELRHAMAIELNNSMAPLSYLDLDNVLAPESLTDVCAGLVTIDAETRVIRLMHTTAQEYFAKCRHELFPNADVEIATVCLLYLSFDEFANGHCISDDELTERMGIYCFLDYAARFWGQHLQSHEIQVEQLAFSFLQNPKKLSSAVQVSHIPTYHYDGYSQIFPQNRPALFVASLFGLHVNVEHLIQQGAKSRAEDNQGITALHLAASNGHDRVASLLLKYGADPEACTEVLSEGLGPPCETPLHKASTSGSEAVARVLLENGANVDKKNGCEQTALHQIAVIGDLSFGQLLVAHGAEINAQDELGWTPLHHAAASGHTDFARFLIGRGAIVDIQNISGGNALQQAATYGYEKLASFLITAGAQVNAHDHSRGTSLHRASSGGHSDVVKLLLDQNADPNTRDIIGGTALQRAAANGYDDVVQLLLDKGADADAPYQFGGTALQRAAANGHEAVTRVLLEGGANPDASQQYGGTALQRASGNGRVRIVRILLLHRANPHSLNSTGGTPLQWAAANGHEGVVRVLLDNGADPNTPHPAGRPALERALKIQNSNIVHMLLEKGARTEDDNQRRKIAELPPPVMTGLITMPDTMEHDGKRSVINT